MIRIGMGQIEITPGNPRKNRDIILQAIEYAKALRLDLLILPELALSGYLIGDVWDQPAFVNECVAMGETIIKSTDNIAVSSAMSASILTKPILMDDHANLTLFSPLKTASSLPLRNRPIRLL